MQAYQPLLNDLQNLILEETKEERIEDSEAYIIRGLLGHTVSVCQRPVPPAEKIFDFHWKKDKCRSTRASPCECGYAHYINGKEYDFIVDLGANVVIGFNSGDYPEENFYRAFEQRQIQVSSEKITKWGKELRSALGDYHFAKQPIKVVQEPVEKKKSVPAVILPKKRTTKRKVERSNLVKSDQHPAQILQVEPSEHSNLVKSNNMVMEKDKPLETPKVKPTSTSNGRSAASGMDDYLKRNQEKLERHKQKLEEEKKRKRMNKAHIERMGAMIRSFETVDISAEELSRFGVSPAPSSYQPINILVKTMTFGDLSIDITPWHKISDIKSILSQLISDKRQFTLVRMAERGLPSIVIDHHTLEEDEITDGTILLQMPTRERFP